MFRGRQGFIVVLVIAALALLAMPGCACVGNKSASLSIVYAATAVISLVLLASYCWIVKKKDSWFLLMFASVLVVNVGYFALSTSHSLEEALLANRIAYFGSVFLPMSMLMVILDVTNMRPPKQVPVILLLISAFVFLVAASPGYSTIYYESVELVFINGAAALDKTYGPWHPMYLVYLVGYFSAMVAVIAYATIRRKVSSNAYAIVLATAVLVNIGVWFLEQLVSIDFEFLSVSYIISECFLLGLHVTVPRGFPGGEGESVDGRGGAAGERGGARSGAAGEGLVEFVGEGEGLAAVNANITDPAGENERVGAAGLDGAFREGSGSQLSSQLSAEDEALREVFLAGLSRLTRTERAVYELHLEGKGTREIMAALDIKENTLKFHNKNLYAKLGVSSRKQLVERARSIGGV